MSNYARNGAPLNRQQAYVLKILEPIYTATPEAREIYAPEATSSARAKASVIRTWPLALERYAAEGAAAIYGGETAAAVDSYVRERGGVLSAEDLAAYEAIERQPVADIVPGLRDPDQPAAVGRRHPDRLLASPCWSGSAAADRSR